MSLETLNPFKIFEKKHQMHYYDGLTPAERAKAWGSFRTWIKNPLGNQRQKFHSRTLVIPESTEHH